LNRAWRAAKIRRAKKARAGSREDIVKNKRTLYRAGPGLIPMDTSKDGKFERSDDWSSCVYFYLDKPTNNLSPIDAVEKRVNGL